METQSKGHPSALHLAAAALNKLKPETAAKIEAHLAECEECRRYVSDTPRSELAELIRTVRDRPAAEQNTPSAGLSGTVTWSTPNESHPSVPASTPVPSPGPVQHVVGEHEIPHDLYVQTKYRILRLLGRGGMGSVYEAVHVRMQRKVAIKTINPELVNNPQVLLRFEEELKAIASLDHPNIARAFDAESFGSVHAIILEFLEGQTLADLVRARGRLSVVDATRSVRQALLGLQSAHQKGFVHRDMKPQNLLVTRDTGVVKILDFGLAKAVSENRLSRGLTSSRMTIGTYAYMSPEQALDAAKADIRADIYSLGCTLYYLLSGKLPFNYEPDAQLLLAHQNETPPPLSAVQPDVPRALSDLVARMLAKNPADRPQTPREAADLLLPFAQGKKLPVASETTQLPSAHAGRSIGGWKWGGLAAALLVLLVFGGWAAGVFFVRTAQGTIVIDGVPDGADVTVDGERISFTRSGDSVAISAVDTGPHHLNLLQNGRELWSNDVTIKVAGELVRARFEPRAEPTTTAQS